MEELLSHLRDSAKNAEHYECLQTAKKLFALMKMRDVLQIALNQAYAHLPAFENLHPEKIWLRQWLDLASSFVPVIWSRGVGFKFYRYFDDQSSNDFVEGIGLLRDAFYAYYKLRQSIVIDLAAGATGYFVSARSLTCLAEKAPLILSQYEEVFKQGVEFSQEERDRRKITAIEHPERRQFIQTCWTQIADEIENCLSMG